MSFTTPKTWAFGEVLTSTDMNIYVRDNTADLDSRIAAGIGPNVVQTVKTNAFSTTSTTLTDVDDLDVTITPTADDSKVLVIVQTWMSGSSSSVHSMTLIRGTTAIYENPTVRSNIGGAEQQGANNGQVFVFLDSPGTDSAVTYKVQISTSGGILYVNRSSAGTFPARSSITAIEVAA